MEQIRATLKVIVRKLNDSNMPWNTLKAITKYFKFRNKKVEAPKS
jgi:hypothetical protein